MFRSIREIWGFQGVRHTPTCSTKVWGTGQAEAAIVTGNAHTQKADTGPILGPTEADIGPTWGRYEADRDRYRADTMPIRDQLGKQKMQKLFAWSPKP